ncbi:cysteine-rich receptor-like protein kinase, partial [Trifolium medium]|nr:cysteine-rich receptor-like protein kinase [Trifolium medium]
MLKKALKEWYITHTKNVSGIIDSLKVRLLVLNCKGEEEGLTEDEIAEIHVVTSDIHSLTRLNTSICWQQARLLWIREGDANS